MQIKKTYGLIEREIHRKNGVLKNLNPREIWEYSDEIKNHPLSIDLDLCTKHGLLPYLDTTVSEEAWNKFQKRLLQIDSESPLLLQKIIKELLIRRSLCYQLLRKSLLPAEEEKSKVSIYSHTAEFSFWKKRKSLRIAYPILGVFTPIWFLLTSIFSLPFAPLLLLINLTIFLSYRKDTLRIWNQILAYVKTIQQFESAWIQLNPKDRLRIQSISKTLRNLGDSSAWTISPIPHFFLNCVFLWDLWKINRFGKWIAANSKYWEEIRTNWIEIESLLPMVNIAFLHPEFEFPIWNENRQLKAESLAHPLLEKNSRVSNALPVCDIGSLFIITGSNMSGKTTYLRSIAINLLLAGSGGPICGKSMSLPLYKIHTLIRSQDSLENGISFFYSEVRRLAEIIRNTSTTSEISILFLDEILKGTNSRERQIATTEILDALREKGAIVFLTTHDLQLAEIKGANIFHFTELEKDGEMIFDFKLRQGVSNSTNALRILKKEGIPIKSE